MEAALTPCTQSAEDSVTTQASKINPWLPGVRPLSSPVLPSQSKLRRPADQQHCAPHPCNCRTKHKPLSAYPLAEKNCHGIDEKQYINQHQRVIEEGLNKLAPA